MNLIIDSYDSLDGKTDEVVSRTDLCKLHFNQYSTLVESYHCAASSSSSSSKKRSIMPAQNRTISANRIALASKLYKGVYTLDGRRAYI